MIAVHDNDPSENERAVSDDDVRLELCSDPCLLASVRGLVRSYVLARGFSTDQADDLVLGVDEACSNAIRHAYHGRTDGRIILAIRFDGTRIEFCLTDHGEPADRNTIVQKDNEAIDLAALQPGGLGMHLMHQVFDEVTHEPAQPKGNIVTMGAVLKNG